MNIGNRYVFALAAIFLAASLSHGAVLGSGNSAPAHVDLRQGARSADWSETVRYSTDWETDAAGATAVVAVDGEEISSEAGSGAVEWRPRRKGTHTLTHRVFVGGEQVGETLTAVFDMALAPDAPVIAPAGGTVGAWPVTVTISCGFAGAAIHYTTDGSEPTEASPVYGGNGGFSVAGRTVVKAISVWEGLASDVAVAEYALGRCETPVIAAAATFSGSRTQVSISCGTPGAEIRYTLDGSDPDGSATLYAGPFDVTGSCTVKARAVSGDYLDSAVASQSIEKVWGIGDTMGAPDHAFATGGDAPFFRVVDAKAPLGEAMQSGAITHEQESTMTTTVDGPGTLTFQWKTSCEEDDSGACEWDHAAFEVDGAEVAKLDGETAWETVSREISGDGPHTLVWRYVKDDVESEGEDCCWVADFVWTPLVAPAYTETQTTPEPVPYAWLRGYYPALADEYEAYEGVASAMAANRINTVWECYVAGLDPTDEAAALRVGIEFEDGEAVVTFDPPRPAYTPAEWYHVLGKTNLTDEAWSERDAGHRFFIGRIVVPEE